MAKFYHYKIWAENGNNGKRLDFNNILNSGVFSSGPHEISGDGTKTYYINFQLIKNQNQYHGTLFRGKDEDAYMRLDSNDQFGQLSKETSDDGEAGEKSSDIVDFGLIQKPKSLHVLLEVGFQTPGIGKIVNYLYQNISNDDAEIKRETKMGEDAEQKVQKLIGTDLKTISVSFKKNPTTYDDLEDADAALDTLTDDNYRFEFGLSLEQGDKSPEKTEKALGELFSILGTDSQPITNSVRQLDFPKMMYSFDVEAEDGNKEIEHNLADTTNKEELNKVYYGFFDQKFGEKLCEAIEQEI